VADPQLQGLAQPETDIFKAHVQAVRLWMRDFGELNLLIRGEESTDRMVAFATNDFLSDFNGTPPFQSFALEDLFARNLQALALRGTAISLLQSVMLIHARNHLPFSDGGLSIQINDKAPLIQSILQLLQSQYEQNKRMVKTAINVQGLLDTGASGVHSDYYALSAIGLY
jgi:hypothetical protein